MPKYDYECRSCHHQFEVEQSMKDDPITECPACHQNSARRIIQKSGIVFKGSGFYVNDKNAAACPNKTSCGCSGHCQGGHTS